MKQLRISFILFWLMSASPASAQQLTELSADQQKEFRETISKLLTHQKEAWNRGDLESFMETYWKSEQLTFCAGGSTTRGWQATLDRYKKRYATPAQMGSLEFKNLEFTFLERKAALILGQWHLVLSDKSVRQGNFSLVVTQIDNQWKIIHDHSSESKSE